MQSVQCRCNPFAVDDVPKRAPAAANAARPAPPGDAANAADSPRFEQSNGVSWVSGGVGEERDHLEQLGRDFNLKRTAATAGGKFFLAKLPPGTYTLGITTDGATKTSKVTIPATGRVSLSTSPAGS